MKTMKKVLSIALALLLVAALAVPALAVQVNVVPPEGSPTQPSEANAETYQAYKIFSASYDAETPAEGGDGMSTFGNIAYTIDLNSPFLTTIKSFGKVVASSTPVFTVNDTTGAVTVNITNFDAAELADKLLAVIKEQNVQATAAFGVSGTNDVRLNDGYFLVVGSLGTKAILDTFGKEEVTIHSKNVLPTVDKKIVNGENKVDSITANIGDKVTFEVRIDLGQGVPIKNITLHDDLSEGLTYTAYTDLVSAKLYARQEGETEATMVLDLHNGSGSGRNGCTNVVNPDGSVDFQIYFDQADSYTGPEGVERYIILQYRASLNDKAVIAGEGNPNSAYLKYGNNQTTETSTATVYTYAAQAWKYHKNGEANEALAGAGFVLKNSEGKYFAQDDTTKAVTWVDSIDSATEVTSSDAADVNVKFEGLANGTYTLVEKTVPAGYNKATDTEVTITDANSDVAQIVNLTGAELPSTGGIGTTIFYIVGGLLVAGAAVLLVTKKRVQA